MRVAELTSPAFAALVRGEAPVVVLVSVGSVEPHGPHLPLGTDTTISEGAARRAAEGLEARGVRCLLAPPVPYGVTECAAAFPGVVSIAAPALQAYLRAVVDGFLAAGVQHVCLVNNHLEPAHDLAVRASIQGLEPHQASVACPLTRRWGRTLSDEFKRGECHAGRYESAMVLAETPQLVDETARAQLPEVPISLSKALMAGVSDFAEMGLSQAYAGAPAAATAAEGEELLGRLASMIMTEVSEALQREV